MAMAFSWQRVFSFPHFCCCLFVFQFVFVPFDLAGQTGESGSTVLKQCVAGPHPSNSSNNSGSGSGSGSGGGRDLGQTLLGQWQARVMLLGLTLELQQYLDGKGVWSPHPPHPKKW